MDRLDQKDWDCSSPLNSTSVYTSHDQVTSTKNNNHVIKNMQENRMLQLIAGNQNVLQLIAGSSITILLEIEI